MTEADHGTHPQGHIHAAGPADAICAEIMTHLHAILESHPEGEVGVSLAQLHHALGGFEAGLVGLSLAAHVSHLLEARLVVEQEDPLLHDSRYATSRLLGRRIAPAPTR